MHSFDNFIGGEWLPSDELQRNINPSNIDDTIDSARCCRVLPPNWEGYAEPGGAREGCPAICRLS